MRQIKVRFDGKIIHKIMQQQKDAALNLLYQIKIALENHFSDSNITATGLKKEKVEEKLKEVAELSSILPSIHHKLFTDIFRYFNKPIPKSANCISYLNASNQAYRQRQSGIDLTVFKVRLYFRLGFRSDLIFKKLHHFLNQGSIL